MTDPLREIAALVHRESGLLLREPQIDALAGALLRLDPTRDAAAVLSRLLDPVVGPADLARLLDEVTVKETFFLRDARQLAQIEWPMLLQRAQAAGSARIRVWSAGCATGEEAYTLALLACEAFGAFDPPVAILATDVSGRALAEAARGEYRARSTRELGPQIRQRYFGEEGDRLVVGSHLRGLVTFARHNLVHDRAPVRGESAFDLILCRNLLIYFDAETVDRAIASLESALAPSGTLLLGAADALCRRAAYVGALRTVAAGEPSIPPRAQARALRRPLGRDDASASLVAVGAAPTATAQFMRGLAELEVANPRGAIPAFRAALYTDPQFGLAAFQLGRAYEAIGEARAARRAYEQALANLEPDLDLHEAVLEQIDLDDVRAAARLRLDSLAAVGVVR